MTPPTERPLVVVTRRPSQSDRLEDALRQQRLDVWTVPLTRPVVRPHAAAMIAASVATLRRVDWVALTSRHGATIFAGVVHQLAQRRSLPRVAAVGPATAQTLRAAGIRVAVVAADGRAETLARAMSAADGDVRGRRVLWPRAAGARRELGVVLRALGHIVIDRVVYTSRGTRTADVRRLRALMLRGRIAAVCLYAPSAVRVLSGLLSSQEPSRPQPSVVAAFGWSTALELWQQGITPDLVASPLTADANAEAIARTIAHVRGAW